MLARALSFINPFSKEYHSCEEFKQLGNMQKLFTLIVVAIISLYSRGVATTPAFRFLVGRLNPSTIRNTEKITNISIQTILPTSTTLNQQSLSNCDIMKDCDIMEEKSVPRKSDRDDVSDSKATPLTSASDSSKSSVIELSHTGIPAQDHYQWCIKRAESYLDAGNLRAARASFVSDMSKHSKTRPCIENELFLQLGFSDSEGFREFIKGFNVHD